jgi:hypothetical protein
LGFIERSAAAAPHVVMRKRQPLKPHPHGDASRRMARRERRIALLPINFFILAVLFFAAGTIALVPISRGVVAGYFYGPWPLALVHTFTLGWITATVMGVMYRYAPALTHGQIPFPRLAIAQFVLFLIASTGMVTHFALGVWFGTWLAAGVMLLSLVLFALNIMPLLWTQVGRGVAETGMFGAICFLLASGTLGTLLAMDKDYGFMGGGLLTNLGAHVALAAVGWVTLAICAVSYRMLPAFILPTIALPRTAIYQLYALAAGVLGLAATLLASMRGGGAWFALMVVSLLAYLATIARLMRARRLPLDWTARHALAGFVWLIAGAAAGGALLLAGAGSLIGSRIAAAFGAAALLGFFSNLIIGMSYHLFAGFVVRARTAAGWAAATADSLVYTRQRLPVFAAFNVGVAILVAGFLTGARAPVDSGAALVATGGVIFALAALRTLSFAYRRSAPVPKNQAMLV